MRRTMYVNASVLLVAVSVTGVGLGWAGLGWAGCSVHEEGSGIVE